MLEDGQRYISQPPWLADRQASSDINGIDITDISEFSIDQMLAASMLVGNITAIILLLILLH